MTVITCPEPDVYGQYARASLLADYVELLVLKEQPVRRAALADFLADNGRSWDLDLIRSAERQVTDEKPGPISEHIDEAGDRASIVFEQMKERSNVLGCRYPFTITDAGEVLPPSPGSNPKSSPYVSILMLTIAHAFNVHSPHRPEELFEGIVTRVLRSRGLRSTGLAAHRRKRGSFGEVLRIACQEVGLKAAPDAAPRLTHAHDEGVDVLCHLAWEEDLRPGTWGFIGQVTVGKSDSWGRKISEPKPGPWARRTGTWIPPLPFLAVPHHVERPMMEKLASDNDAVVLDRLRLVRWFKDKISAEEQEVIRAVDQEEVEPLTG